jgi:hypothetical protein
MSDELDPIPIERVNDSGEAAVDGGVLGTPWDRRTFLKAAAIGTAAVAMWERGPGLSGPLSAYANDLSLYPCTANDVTIEGTGHVINEPCVCSSGTFQAIVQFDVANHTGTERYCIVLHLPASGSIPQTDVVLHNNPDGLTGGSTATRNTTTTMYGVIGNFPCSAGTVCFGTEGTVRGKCSALGKCATVAWSTTPADNNCGSADQSPPHGQCRHQNICIVGFGATLDCVDANGASTACDLGCGGTAHLKLCVSGGTSPYIFKLFTTDGTTETLVDSFPNNGTFTTATCHTFDVTPSTTTTYVGKVFDSTSPAGTCHRDATKTVTVSAITASIAPDTTNPCDGVVTFTASGSGGAACSGDFATWTIDGGSLSDFLGELGTDSAARIATDNGDGTLTYRSLDGCHNIGVSITCGGCTGTASASVSQCVTTTNSTSDCP